MRSVVAGLSCAVCRRCLCRRLRRSDLLQQPLPLELQKRLLDLRDRGCQLGFRLCLCAIAPTFTEPTSTILQMTPAEVLRCAYGCATDVWASATKLDDT